MSQMRQRDIGAKRTSLYVVALGTWLAFWSIQMIMPQLVPLLIVMNGVFSAVFVQFFSFREQLKIAAIKGVLQMPKIVKSAVSIFYAEQLVIDFGDWLLATMKDYYVQKGFEIPPGMFELGSTVYLAPGAAAVLVFVASFTGYYFQPHLWGFVIRKLKIDRYLSLL